MKLLVIATLVAYVAADVSHVVGAQGSEATAKIVSQELDSGPDGSYQWSYNTENGITSKARGSIRPVEDTSILQVEGGASWVAPDGEKVEFTYIADENGYFPQGANIPTPPPIPEAILRSLEYIRTHPPRDDKQ